MGNETEQSVNLRHLLFWRDRSKSCMARIAGEFGADRDAGKVTSDTGEARQQPLTCMSVLIVASKSTET
jgi:hypothetical protein